MKLIVSVICLALSVTGLATPGGEKSPSVQQILARRLPSLGHRNWIVVADSAYPYQTAPGIETITVTDSQLSVVKKVFAALRQSRHVRPIIYVDSELKFVPEDRAPGISTYRKGLNQLLAGKKVERMLHEKIIAKLDEAGKSFRILLIKTPHTQPYTSVFFQLDCAYWSAESEQALRKAMSK